MLKKTQRLTTSQFDQFFASGKRNHFTHLTIIYHPAKVLQGAAVVGKKVSKSAVRRNTLRRRVYARLAQVVMEKAVTGVFIIILKPSYNSLTRVAADEFLRESIVAVAQKA
jgi:ribonuclease P protein component